MGDVKTGSCLNHKDLLGIRDLDAEEIRLILDTAEEMRQRMREPVRKFSLLQGKTVMTLFFENSTRTRMSFETAAKFLGATVSSVPVANSSVKKGESLLDTALTLDQMATDFVIMRHQLGGAPHFVAARIGASVINAGDGMHEHPTQCLLDLFTIRRHLKRLSGLKVAIIGDCLHSRVFHSNLYAFRKLGSEVYCAGPSSMMPYAVRETGAVLCRSVEEALDGADVVIALRIQLERMQAGLFPSVADYARYYGLNPERMRLAKKAVLLLHPGPVNRGVELNSDVYWAPNTLINEQVGNGVAVRMAVLHLLNQRRETLRELGQKESYAPAGAYPLVQNSEQGRE